MQQLDLFAWKAPKPTAVILSFPTNRRADLVRETAAELMRRSYEGGRRFWASHVKQVRRDLKAAGRSPSEIEAEITAYSQAVRRKIYGGGPVREASR